MPFINVSKDVLFTVIKNFSYTKRRLIVKSG